MAARGGFAVQLGRYAVEAAHGLLAFARIHDTREPLLHAMDAVRARARNSE